MSGSTGTLLPYAYAVQHSYPAMIQATLVSIPHRLLQYSVHSQKVPRALSVLT